VTTSDDDPFKGMTTAPGTRCVEVRDERTTHRVRWEQIPLDAPDPVRSRSPLSRWPTPGTCLASPPGDGSLAITAGHGAVRCYPALTLALASAVPPAIPPATCSGAGGCSRAARPSAIFRWCRRSTRR